MTLNCDVSLIIFKLIFNHFYFLEIKLLEIKFFFPVSAQLPGRHRGHTNERICGRKVERKWILLECMFTFS